MDWSIKIELNYEGRVQTVWDRTKLVQRRAQLNLAKLPGDRKVFGGAILENPYRNHTVWLGCLTNPNPTEPNLNRWLGLAWLNLLPPWTKLLVTWEALVNMVMIYLPLKLGPTPLYYPEHSLVGPSQIDFCCERLFGFHPMNCLESWLCTSLVSEVVKLTKAGCFIQGPTKIFWWATWWYLCLHQSKGAWKTTLEANYLGPFLL